MEKPKVTICVIDFPRAEAICGETNPDRAKDLEYKNVVSLVMHSATMRRVPLSTLDKNVCFAPKQWELVQNYIDALERALRNK